MRCSSARPPSRSRSRTRATSSSPRRRSWCWSAKGRARDNRGDLPRAAQNGSRSGARDPFSYGVVGSIAGGLPRARELLARHWGYPRFRVPQLRVLGPLLAGRNVLTVLPTGAGKSLCYQVPALMGNALTLVVSPLISLMQDQVGALRRRGVAAAYLNSALPREARRAVLEATLAGQVRLLYCAPERLGSLVGALRRAGIRPALLAVDEAHCITEWGNEFRPVYRQLGRWRYLLGDPRTLGLTAAVRRRVLDAFLGDRVAVVVATTAFGMGIDKPDVRRVLHWGPARTLEGYYQEAGRAGRDGGPAGCWVLWRPEDFGFGEHAAAMRRYVEARRCRRRMLLQYFGERLDGCSGCDVCGEKSCPARARKSTLSRTH